jgi:hypothetical protein
MFLLYDDLIENIVIDYYYNYKKNQYNMCGADGSAIGFSKVPKIVILFKKPLKKYYVNKIDYFFSIIKNIFL